MGSPTGSRSRATKAKPKSKAEVKVETKVEVKSKYMRNSGLSGIFAGIIAVLGVVFFFMTYYTVAEYERGVLTRFGQIQSVEGPGLHFKMPFVNSITFYRTDIQASATKQPINTYTIDNQEVDVMFTIHFRLTPDKIEFVYRNAQDYQPRLEAMAIDRLKAEMGKVNVAHVAEKRGAIRDAIKNAIATDALEKYGVTVVDFQLTNLEYTKSFKQAVEAAAAAKANVETREQERQQALLTAERMRVEAKGKADSYLFEREAEAKGIKLKGEAEAAAIKARADALASNAQLVELEKAQRWDGKLPSQIFAGAPIPFINIDKGK